MPEKRLQKTRDAYRPPVWHTRFRVECEPIDVTMNGMFGGEPDTCRKFMPGLRRFYVDGVLVTEDQFRAAVHEAETTSDLEPTADAPWGV